MLAQVLVDIGPMVALINKNDTYHAWAVSEAAAIEMPLRPDDAAIADLT